MAAFHFELVSPEKLLFSGDVESVVAPGVEGQFTVLKDHAPVMTTLKAGVVDGRGRRRQDREAFRARRLRRRERAAASPFSPSTAIPLSELDAAKLDADIKNAREDVADAKTDEARQRPATSWPSSKKCARRWRGDLSLHERKKRALGRVFFCS